MDQLQKDEKILTTRIEELKIKKTAYQIIKKIGIIIVILYFALYYIFGLTRMNGMDMNPKITDGDLLIYYRIQNEYCVNDIVTFKINNKRYVLRIIALEGQTVDITENRRITSG